MKHIDANVDYDKTKFISAANFKEAKYYAKKQGSKEIMVLEIPEKNLYFAKTGAGKDSVREVVIPGGIKDKWFIDVIPVR